MKALFTAHVLARLEEDLEIDIRDSFDLITGTSAGGIIALALGAGLRPAEIVEHYTKLARTVFPRRRRAAWRLPARAIRPTYRQGPLREALTEILGERTLLNSEKRLLVPSWDLHNGNVHIFKTPHHPRLRRDWRIRMVDVALATSAAPTFLPAAEIDGHRLVDGGIWANNPSVLGIGEAVSMLEVPLGAISVLNIGTTTELQNPKPSLLRGGLGTWAMSAVPTILNAASRGGEGIAMHLIGKENYCRFDAHVPGGLYALDDANPRDLVSLASRVSRNLSPAFTDRFADHRAPAYAPLITGSKWSTPNQS